MGRPIVIVLTVLLVGLGSGRAEARFGKHSGSSSSGGHTHSSSGVGVPRSHPSYGSYGSGYGYGPGYGYYGYYDPWYRYYYYYDPAWAWPYLGPSRPLYGRYYDLMWRNRMAPRPLPQVDDSLEQPTRMDLSVDAGLVSQGYVTGLGMQVDGELLGFGARLNVLNLAADDGSQGRDTLSLLSLKPSVLLVARDELRVRVAGGVDMAFAPDAIFVGPGVGASMLLRLVGPLKLEMNGNWTPFPFTQLSGEAGLALELRPVRVRAGYRTIYLDDQGHVDPGYDHREFFSGPFAGLALML